MTAEILPPAPSLVLLDTLVRLVESDPTGLAKARTLADCDRDDAIAGALGILIDTLADDPRAAERRDLVERAKEWLRSFQHSLAQRRRFVVMAHRTAPEIRARYGTDITPDELLDSSFCEAVAAIPDEDVERDRVRSEKEKRLRAELFNNDWELERQAWKNGTHPLHPKNRAASA